MRLFPAGGRRFERRRSCGDSHKVLTRRRTHCCFITTERRKRRASAFGSSTAACWDTSKEVAAAPPSAGKAGRCTPVSATKMTPDLVTATPDGSENDAAAPVAASAQAAEPDPATVLVTPATGVTRRMRLLFVSAATAMGGEDQSDCQASTESGEGRHAQRMHGRRAAWARGTHLR